MLADKSAAPLPQLTWQPPPVASLDADKEGMCINGCKEACTYCLKHHGKS